MKIGSFLFLLLVLLLVSSCSVWKTTLSSKGNIDTAINNIITDFINTTKLSKTNEVFDISVIDKGDYYIISTGEALDKIYPRFDNIIGSKDNIFPTKYVIRDGKLFYWNDPKQAITQEILNVLFQFNHIDTDWRDRLYNIPLSAEDGDIRIIYIPPLTINDAEQRVVYHMCKNNFTNYKKTGADNLLGHYKKPKLRCN